MQATSIRRVPRRWFTLSIASAAVLATVAACGGGDDGPSAEQAADRVFINGTVLTVNAQDAQAQAIAVKDGKVLRVGSLADVKAVQGSQTEVIDLGGKTVIPGFQDAHSHLTYTGSLSFQADLNPPPIGGVASMQAVLDRLRAQLAANPQTKVLTGFGYDDTLLAERRHPTRDDLDQVSTSLPIIITHISGHLSVANSAALAQAGVTRDTPNPSGGVIRRDAQGEPNGVLEETAAALVTKLVPALTPEQRAQAIESAAKTYVAQGITTANESATSVATVREIDAVALAGKLPIRVVAQPTLAELNTAFDVKLASGKVRISGIKEFSDGSIQGYTGYLGGHYHTPFNGDADYRGFPRYDREVLAERVSKVYAANRQIFVHANGDAAIDDVLYAFGKAQQANPTVKNRPVVIHSQMMREDQLDQLKALGGIPSFFNMHTYYWGDRHRDIFMGPERAERMSPAASAQARGMVYTLHADTPVVPMEPMRMLWSAVNRVSTSGQVIGAAQRVTPAQALRALTYNGAFQNFEEAERGSIEVGKYADLVVLSGNPLTVPAMAIKDIQVQETVFEGKTVYRR